MIKSFRFSLSILTKIPAGNIGTITDKLWENSVFFYPICGYILAVIAVVPLFYVTQIVFIPLIIQAVFIVFLLFFLTGGIHLDGLADTCDSFFCSASKERRIDIMHDSRLGSFGVIGLILLLLAKFSAIYFLLSTKNYIAIFSMIVVSRFFIVLMVKIGKYFDSTLGMGKEIIGKISFRHLIISFILILPLFFLCKNLCTVFLVLILIALFIKHKSTKKVGGISGDILGCVCELAETVGLILLTFKSL